MPSPALSPEIIFHAGELALVTRTEASPFRMREVRRVAARLSPDHADRLAAELQAYAAHARREGSSPALRPDLEHARADANDVESA